jgi:uncharacterized Tic20 family protein
LGPKFIRLGCHDCIGGCDGSIDLSDPDNAGLQRPIRGLRPFVNCYAEWLTRADIWALATLTAAEAMQPQGDDMLLSFPLEWVGRTSLEQDDTGAEFEHEMPSVHLTTSELFQFFEDEFGFTSDEAVALMGAHSVYVPPPVYCTWLCDKQYVGSLTRELVSSFFSLFTVAFCMRTSRDSKVGGITLPFVSTMGFIAPWWMKTAKSRMLDGSKSKLVVNMCGVVVATIDANCSKVLHLVPVVVVAGDHLVLLVAALVALMALVRDLLPKGATMVAAAAAAGPS